MPAKRFERGGLLEAPECLKATLLDHISGQRSIKSSRIRDSCKVPACTKLRKCPNRSDAGR